jgi:hypothetical protein
MMPPYKHQVPSKSFTGIDVDTYGVENTLTFSLGETLCYRLRRHQEFTLFDLGFVSILTNISRTLERLLLCAAQNNKK